MPKITKFNLSGTPCFGAIHPAVTKVIQKRFDAYHQSGMEIDKAIERAVSDHLKELSMDRASMVADINRQLKENHGDLLVEPYRAPKDIINQKEAEPAKAETQQADNSLETKPYTHKIHTDLFKSLRDGEAIDVQTVKDAFKSLVDSKEALVAELNVLKKDDLLNKLGRMESLRYKNEKKDRIVKKVYDDMVTDFAYLDGSDTLSWSHGQKIEDVIQRRVDNITTDTLKAFADRHAANKQAYLDRMKGLEKSLKDPETYEEFSNFFSMKRDVGIPIKEARKLLTLEQRETWDSLSAIKTRGTRINDQNKEKTEVKVAAQTTGAKIVEGKHSKHHYPIWSVQLEEKVDGQSYKDLLSTAKRMGGNYVNTMQARMWKTVWGFQFKDEDSAKAFMKLAAGDSTEAKEKLQERRDAFADDRSQTAVERLREMADSLEERAEEEKNRDRKANTAKRAGQAASAIAKAERDIAMAKTMRNLADHIESGKAVFLDRVRTKAQIEMLESMANTAHYTTVQETMKDAGYDEREYARKSPPVKSDIDAAEFPTFTAYRSDLARLGREMEEIDGTKKLGAELTKIANDVSAAYLKFAKENLHKISTFGKKNTATGDITGAASFGTRDSAIAAIARYGYKGKATVVSFKRGEHLVVMGPEMAKEAGLWEGDNDKLITLPATLGEQIVAKNKSLGKRNRLTVPWTFDATQEKRTRLKSMMIETGPELRSALREYLDARETAKAPDKVKELERAMVGKKSDGLDFFPTPPATSQEMIEAADIQEGMSILEPSAGMGHIADQIRESGVDPDVVEMSGARRELLEAKGYNLVGSDFMDIDKKYDRIIMNPPFSNRRDAEHVQHAFTLLRPGGRIVALMGEGVFFGQDKKAVQFRDWLDSVGGTSEKLPEGTFKDPSLPVNTGVNGRMVVIDAPGEYSPLVPSSDKVEYSDNKPPASAVSPDSLKEHFSAAISSSKVPINVYADESQLPENIQQDIRSKNIAPEAFFDHETGSIGIVASNVESIERAQEVMRHEWFHAGVADKELDALYRYLSRKDSIGLQSVADSRGFDLTTDVGRRKAAGEYSAQIAETLTGNVLWQRLVAKIKDWVRSLGIDINMGASDVIATIHAAMNRASNGISYPTQSTPEYSRFEIVKELDKMRAELFRGGASERKVIEIRQTESASREVQDEHDRDRQDEARGYFTSNLYGYEATQLASSAKEIFDSVRNGDYSKSEGVGRFHQAVIELAKESPESHAAIVALAAELRKAGHIIPTDNSAEFTSHLIEAIDEEARLAGDYQLDTSGPVAGDVEYSLSSQEAIKRAAETLQRYGTPSRLVKGLSDVFPRAANAMNYLFSTPVFHGERDALLRGNDEIGVKDFVDAGISRSNTNMEFQLVMQGWDGFKDGAQIKAPTLGERLKSGYTEWESSDTSTAWGRIEKEVRTTLSLDQQKALDTIITEGDVYGKVYQSLAQAMRNSRIAASKPSEATFSAYRKMREFIDGHVAQAREELVSKLGKATGVDEATVASTIKKYRSAIGKLDGWLPRRHGEGTHQVNVYHKIKSLPFTMRAIDGGHIAALPFYAGKAVGKEIRTIAQDNALLVTRNHLGAPIVVGLEVMYDKLEAKVKKLEKQLAKTIIEEEREILEAKLEKLRERLEIAKLPTDERVQRFIVASAGILSTVKERHSAQVQKLQEELDAAEHPSEVRRIKAEISALGDGNPAVKIYMRLHETAAQAKKHKEEVGKDIESHLDHVFHAGEEYVTNYKVIDPISEAQYGDITGDFASENIINKAIEKATASGRIKGEDAAAVRKALYQSYADKILARGAGRDQIRRAPYLIMGYDTDNATQLFHDYMTATAGMISKAAYAKQQFDNYRYAPNDVKPWAEKYIRDTLRNMGYADRVGGNVRAMATFMYLGFKVSSIIVNATQTWTLGVAELGRRTKQNSVKAIGKAQLDILKGRLSDAEKKIFNDQIWKEQEMATAIHEMSGAGEGITGKASSFMHTLVNKSLLPFQEVEMLNRRSMVLASYRAFLADGMAHDKALSSALDVNRKVNFEMSRANLPGFAHNPVGRTAYALQSFVWNNWNWIYNRATSGEKKDLVALLKYAAMISAIGGVTALAGGDEINKMIRRLTGNDYRLAMQVWMRKHSKEYGTPGELMNAMVWHGGMGALGVNISNAMRLNIPLSGFITGESTAGEAAMGIWSGVATKAQNVVKYAGKGDTYKAIESGMPEVISGPMKAYRMASKGVTTSHGKPVLDEHGNPLKYSGADAAKRAIGLQPMEQSFRAEVTQAQRSLAEHWNGRRSDLLDKLNIARGEDRKSVIKEVVQFNREVRKSQAWPAVNIISAKSIAKSNSASKVDKKKMALLRNAIE